jgi:hypothetical protein
MTTEKISQVSDDRGFLFYTTHVNAPRPAMVGLKVIKVVQRDGLVERGLPALRERYDCIGDVRGRSLLLGIEFDALDPGQRHSARALSDAVTDKALQFGLSANIVRTGASDGIMRIAPPLTATDAEIDLGLKPGGCGARTNPRAAQRTTRPQRPLSAEAVAGHWPDGQRQPRPEPFVLDGGRSAGRGGCAEGRP